MKVRSLKYLAFEGMKNIWVNRLMTLASVGVLVACMLLMGAAVLFSMNVDTALGTLQDQNVVLVYLEDATTAQQAQTAFVDISKLSNVKDAKFISKEDGMKELINDMGENYEELFKWIDDEDGSFLPFGVQVAFEDLEKYDATIKQIKNVEFVDHINDSRELTRLIVAVRKTVTVAGMWVIGLLLITALVIISNTIKITMHSRKLEITIMKAVGATNNFVRLPFVVEGMIFGIISAIISTGLLYFAYKMTINQVMQMVSSQMVSFKAIPFNEVVWWMLAGFCLLGLIAGSIGSVISIGKYLNKEGSELSAF